MTFESLELCPLLLRNLESVGYREATPIQHQAIPPLLQGRDLVGCAQTGTGKTAAFVLPILQRLIGSSESRRDERRRIRALILAPTRELAAQVADHLATLGDRAGIRHLAMFGGVPQGPQARALKAGLDVLVATPGRLLDLVGQGLVHLAAVEVLVLDEADQMLDMGFLRDLRRIVGLIPRRRQTLMFSATMPPRIRELAQQWLRDPVEVCVTPVASTPERVSQTVYFVERPHKPAALTQWLKITRRSRTLVFTRTKRGADKLARGLYREGIHAISIHGDKSQSRRRQAMRAFNSRRPPVLVATDLAARGLDFADVSHVINYDLPDTPEIYVHRIGRTARAGAAGHAVSFCGRDERSNLRMIERLIGQRVAIRQWADAVGEQPRPTTSETAMTDGAPCEENGRSAERGERTSRSRTRRRAARRPAVGPTPGRQGFGKRTRRKRNAFPRRSIASDNPVSSSR